MKYSPFEISIIAFVVLSCLTFWAVMIMANYKSMKRTILRKLGKQKKFESPVEKLIKRLQDEAGKAIKKAEEEHRDRGPKEVMPFQWRHEGKLQTVNIVIDPALDEPLHLTKERFEEMVKEGNAGRMSDLMEKLSGQKPEDFEKVQEFVFSRKSVTQMKAAGLTPEDIVAKMLKAAGRM